MSPNAPMTEEQLDFFTQQTVRAVKKATRRFAVAASVGYLLLIAGVVGMYENGQSVSAAEQNAIVRSGRAVAVDGCNGRFQDRQKIRAVFQRSKDATEELYKHGALSKARRDSSIEFYDHELREFPLPDCRAAEKILTDDPGHSTTQPVPRFPGDGRDE